MLQLNYIVCEEEKKNKVWGGRWEGCSRKADGG